jgi:3-hydroxyisobutyrate dehydrogenase
MLACEEKGERTLPVLSYVKEVFETLSTKGYDDFGTQAIIDYYLKKMA